MGARTTTGIRKNNEPHVLGGMFTRVQIMQDIIAQLDGGVGGDTVVVAHTTYRPLLSQSALNLWVHAKDEAYAGGEAVEVKLYREEAIDGTVAKHLVATLSGTTPAVAAGSAGRVEIDDLLEYIKDSTHYSVSATFTAAANGYIQVVMDKVNGGGAAGSGGSSASDDSAFTAGSSSGTPIMGAATTDTVDSGDLGILRMTTDRRLEVAGYNSVAENIAVAEDNPLNLVYQGSTMADITNGTDGTYYYYQDMSGYSRAGFQLELDGGSGTVTVTLEGTLQDDGTAAASCTYQDITNDTFGLASTTATDTWIDDSGKLGLFKYIRLKVVASTGGSNDADWTIYAKETAL